MLVSLVNTQPAAAVTPLLQTDVAAFSSRAEAWTDARAAHRDVAREHALELASDARQAEEDRLAAAEAERQAEIERQRAAEEAARTTTTLPPPTTATPTTVPSTTVPPTTVPSTAVAPTTVPGASEDPAPADPVADPAPGGPTPAQWESLRRCESSGNYAIVSANGRYRGAYQFSQATWDWIAATANPALVGVDPASASPADQDEMARALWDRRGWSPWPICGAAAAAA